MKLHLARYCYLLLFGLLLFVVGCRVEYHPYDTQVDGPTDINARNIARINTATEGKRSIRFVVISDTQRWYDETEKAVESINRLEGVDFVIHTGDISDFGMKAEFERQRDILNHLHIPYVCLIGNHDCLASGATVFEKVFGKPDFAFVAGNVRFVCLNTNALEYDYSSSIPDFGFIEEQLSVESGVVEKSIVAMHAKPYTDQFNNNTATLFHRMIRQFPALQFCLNGHGHSFCIDDLFDDGVLYYECDAAFKRTYLLFTVDDNGYNYERIAY